MCIPGNSFVGGFIPVLIAQASFWHYILLYMRHNEPAFLESYSNWLTLLLLKI
jgi:hypothetical protein